MRHFRLLVRRPSWDRVLALRGQLDEHPELWNVRRERIEAGPFVGTDDIWVRTNDDRPFRDGLRPWGEFNDPYWAVWYPEALQLPAARELAYELMATYRGEYLGSVLVTRIPPGAQVRPHADAAWHAEFHNLKVYLPVATNDRCVNYCGDESVVMRAGEAWAFDNLVTHSVVNGGDTPRVTLIVSMRVDPSSLAIPDSAR